MIQEHPKAEPVAQGRWRELFMYCTDLGASGEENNETSIKRQLGSSKLRSFL